MQGHCYRVNDKKFYSIYSALRCAVAENSFARYHVPQWHMDAYESVNIKQALQHDPTYWIDKKLDYIFNNFKESRLLYSGGSDSHTILDRGLKMGKKFDHVLNATRSITYDVETPAGVIKGWYDMCSKDGHDYLKANPQCGKKTNIYYTTIEDYELWLDPDVAFNIPDFYFVFQPSWRHLMIRPYGPMEWTVEGNAKPTLLKKDDGYYWFHTDSCIETAALQEQSNTCSFYSDGIVPELSVTQAYITKQFFEEYMPEANGHLDVKSLPFDLRKKYLQAIGRSPSLSSYTDLGAPGAKTKNFINDKHIKALRDFKQMGRMDIVEGWNTVRKNLLQEFRDVPYALEIQTMQHPYDDDAGEIEIPMAVGRIGFAYKMEEDRLVRIPNKELFS